MENFVPGQSLFQSPSPSIDYNPAQNDIARPAAEAAPPARGSKKKLIIFLLVVILLVGVSIGAFLLIKAQTASTQKSETQAVVDQASNSRVIDSENLANKTQIPVNNAPIASKDQPENFYSNQTLGFSIVGPQNWEKTESSNGVLVIYEDPQKYFDENNLEFHPNVNVGVEPIGESMTLDQYSKAGNSQRALLFNNYVLLGSSKESLGGEPAYIDDYTISSGSLNTRQRQVYTIKGGNAYIVTFATLPRDWDNYLTTFDNVRSTFEFTGTVSGASTKNGMILGTETGFNF